MSGRGGQGEARARPPRPASPASLRTPVMLAMLGRPGARCARHSESRLRDTAARHRRPGDRDGGTRQPDDRLCWTVQPRASGYRGRSLLLLRRQRDGVIFVEAIAPLHPACRTDRAREGERWAGERRVSIQETLGRRSLADRPSRRGRPHPQPAEVHFGLSTYRGIPPGGPEGTHG